VADHLAPLFALPLFALPKLRALELYEGAVPDRALPVRALEQVLASRMASKSSDVLSPRKVVVR
jgi:hypothetical protein